MKDFPEFMKNPANRIKKSSQYTQSVEGYVFDGKDGSQAAFWTCSEDRISEAHTHSYDEYIVCVDGRYSIRMNGQTVTLNRGDEIVIPKDTTHSGECIADTRTIHFFGGKRAQRESE